MPGAHGIGMPGDRHSDPGSKLVSLRFQRCTEADRLVMHIDRVPKEGLGLGLGVLDLTIC